MISVLVVWVLLLEWLINPFDGTLWGGGYAYLSPAPAEGLIIPTTISGAYVTTTAIPGYGTIPPLPEICWGMNYTDLNNNFCYFWHYGFACDGFGNNECQPNPPPYIPQ